MSGVLICQRRYLILTHFAIAVDMSRGRTGVFDGVLFGTARVLFETAPYCVARTQAGQSRAVATNSIEIPHKRKPGPTPVSKAWSRTFLF